MFCRPRQSLVLSAVLTLLLVSAAAPRAIAQRRAAQQRPAGARIAVPAERIGIDDGDTVVIDWPDGDSEVVRILGIDAPEIRHDEHNIPYDQPFGSEATGFARGAFAVAHKIDLLRSPTKDPYGRTLGYLFLDGRNYSELILRARLAVETITRYGDNGLPQEAAACLAAAKEAGPPPFEDPQDYRERMRTISDWMRKGTPSKTGN